MEKVKIYRQGDVLIKTVDEIPESAIDITPEDRIVLAHGEVTGHAHVISCDHAKEYSFAEAGDLVRRFLNVFKNGAKVTHEEHNSIKLSPGFYEIIQQREYSPESIRNVQD